jgi:ERCC4-related helicase
MGRTARFRKGKVIIFIQEGEEEEKIYKSKLNS